MTRNVSQSSLNTQRPTQPEKAFLINCHWLDKRVAPHPAPRCAVNFQQKPSHCGRCGRGKWPAGQRASGARAELAQPHLPGSATCPGQRNASSAALEPQPALSFGIVPPSEGPEALPSTPAPAETTASRCEPCALGMENVVGAGVLPFCCQADGSH